ncbi:hypothetical protein FZEAL_2373 [Fusarium zealandicum]|uniref:Uncharacterized protein n=1 Tax=Fusarium zealandicum TaxID=1053134 RepID=A0A8H4URK8_9HYPO|nr:hypothetical protein FZEAL_2373 [Fusarium zealandicum]
MISLGMDCSRLEQLNESSEHINDLNSATQFENSKLRRCKTEIFKPIYGTGNPDISDIAVAVGYVLELVLGVFLSLAAIYHRCQRQNNRARQWHSVIMSGRRAYSDSVAYFAPSLQLAIITPLVRKDYGISTADLGAIEARIAQSVAVLSMMPLLYPVALLGPGVGKPRGGAWHNARLLLLSVSVALSFYPFLSRCINAFGASPIGDGDGAEVSAQKWGTVEAICFPDRYRDLRGSTAWMSVDSLELTASLIAYLFTFWLLAGLPSTRYVPDEEAKGQFGSERACSWQGRLNTLRLAIVRTLQR